MEQSKRNLISISYAKRVLESGSREQGRMITYAESFSQYHVIVFTFKKDSLPQRFQNNNLYVYGTDSRTRIGALCTAVLIGRKILKENNLPTIVSSQDPFETSLVARLISVGYDTKNHLQIHGDVFNPASYTSSILNRIRNLCGKWFVSHTPSIRVVSQRIKRSLLSLGVKESVISVVPIQVSMDTFLKEGSERVYQSKENVSFLYVGRFATEKNLLLLLQAFYQLSKKHQNCTLTLVGSGPEKAKIEDFIQKHSLVSLVHIKSWTEDVAVEMSKHDVFCLSSNHEGWAMVLQEAAAVGMGVVTTDVGCAGEFILHKENGLVVPVGDVEAYTAAMTDFVLHPELLVSIQKRAYSDAKAAILPEATYLKKLVDSYPS
jgi:glycosyltransferase involved in cell wall biosynthesis